MIDEVTGQVLDDEPEVDDNVRPLRPQRPPPRPGVRRTTVSGRTESSSDDSKALIAHARTIEVEGASDRLGLGELRETLVASEEARRGLTQDLIGLGERHEAEVDRVRNEYDRAFDSLEARHEREATKWREERDRLRRECERLEREAKDQRKAKKKHKKSVAEQELKIEELRQAGMLRHGLLTMLAPGVSPIAGQVARHIPDLISFLRTAMGATPEPVGDGSDDETVLDRAAAIRFAGNLFSPQNEELLEDLKRLAVDFIDMDGKAVVVQEWDRVQRYIWSALRRESEAARKAEVSANPKPEEKQADAS